MPARPVLVIDDNPHFVRAITAAAGGLGLPVIATDDPDMAIPLLARGEPAAAIIDCMLGERSGLAVLAVIGATMPDLPTLVVSGYGEAFLAQAGKEAESHGLTRLSTLAKPFALEALRQFLAEACAPA